MRDLEKGKSAQEIYVGIATTFKGFGKGLLHKKKTEVGGGKNHKCGGDTRLRFKVEITGKRDVGHRR